MRRVIGVMLPVLALCVACSRGPEPAGDGLLTKLSTDYAPYQACVVDGLRTRRDFDGRLPEMIVQAGLADSLQDASRRYLGQASDLAALDETGRVEATRQALQALGAFGAAIGQGSEQSYPDNVRRQMSMVEVMQIMAAAASVDCSPSDSLLSAMEVANNEYF
ncbi:hypothetical protein [Arenimonas daejeonensis]|uniref:hypothetical protein n=1 Tax=Arenimonas daejeonensis TaxID=370777 RepID=UPI00158012A1|nr:hypothetical protein [Arenimonas daejeonensis]